MSNLRTRHAEIVTPFLHAEKNGLRTHARDESSGETEGVTKMHSQRQLMQSHHACGHRIQVAVAQLLPNERPPAWPAAHRKAPAQLVLEAAHCATDDADGQQTCTNCAGTRGQPASSSLFPPPLKKTVPSTSVPVHMHAQLLFASAA
jgi:hypothetical protein